jgi:hypothetical protein
VCAGSFLKALLYFSYRRLRTGLGKKNQPLEPEVRAIGLSILKDAWR